jgi:hypothetical protein
MPSDDQANETADAGVAADAQSACVKSACVALVPTVEPARRSGTPARLSRPDPSFVTQLIATAERLPQTRLLRRATSTEALTAYRARQHRGLDAGSSTRQTA